VLNDTTADRYQTLLDVSESIVSHQQLQTLLPDLAVSLRRLVRFDAITMTLYDPDQRTIRLLLFHMDMPAPVEPGRTFPVEDTPAILVLDSAKPYYVSDLGADERFPSVHNLMRSIGVESYVIAPMLTARRGFIGGLNFASLQKGAYTADDLEFMSQVARQVAIAVENALNYEAAASYQRQLAAERDRLRLLLDINNAVVTHLDIASLLGATTSCLRSALGIEFAALALQDENGDLRREIADLPEGIRRIGDILPLGSPAHQACESRQPVIVGPPGFGTIPEVVRIYLNEHRIEAVCAIPLISRNRILGAMTVASRRANPFPEENVRSLVEVAGQVAIAIDNALSYRRIEDLNAKLAQQKLYLEDEIRSEFRFEEIIGRSAALNAVLRQVETVAPSDSAVVISGETGTGKELVARAIHDLSARRHKTFVKLNCAAIPTGLLESELFGHE
jgi:formate hydrogenlyase transcriptional activator